ncbi:hypothetical protein A2U01_0107333, partial [Trifolium medium]|nr:hypothetical protein [Trifolium medium]
CVEIILRGESNKTNAGRERTIAICGQRQQQLLTRPNLGVLGAIDDKDCSATPGGAEELVTPPPLLILHC